MSDARNRPPTWFWYAMTALQVAGTAYFYPRANEWFIDPLNPYAAHPGVVGATIVAAAWALPLTLVGAGVIYILAFTALGAKIRDAFGQVLGCALMAAIGLGILSAVLSPGSCSSDPYNEPRQR